VAPFDAVHVAAACAAAFLAGAVNSIAGGGTLITFPTLIWLGLTSVIANATNTVAIWPGSLGSIWGFRNEIRQTDRRMRWLTIPSLLGGGLGALLLRMTPASVFDHLVPFLLLFATLLFTVQGPIQARLRARRGEPRPQHAVLPVVLAVQFLIAIYGGYFGAGMGIIMLSALSLLGMTDILQMSGLTSLYGLCINGVAAVLFIATRMVYWPYVVPMAICAIIAGYVAAGVARRIGKVIVRRFVMAVGFSISLLMFVRAFV
jgi:uncharacterized membrane protein YfcA